MLKGRRAGFITTTAPPAPCPIPKWKASFPSSFGKWKSKGCNNLNPLEMDWGCLGNQQHPAARRARKNEPIGKIWFVPFIPSFLPRPYPEQFTPGKKGNQLKTKVSFSHHLIFFLPFPFLYFHSSTKIGNNIPEIELGNTRLAKGLIGFESETETFGIGKWRPWRKEKWIKK